MASIRMRIMMTGMQVRKSLKLTQEDLAGDDFEKLSNLILL
jgi:hypothetical protein